SVPGATVTATNTGTGAVYNATTSDQGVYVFAQLPVGTYEVDVKKASFKAFVAKNVEVHTSTSTDISAKLDIGAASETITVEASDVQVETSQASVGEVVEGTQVRELPLNGENFMGLVTLSPGVSQANDFNSRDKGLLGGSDFSVNGNPYTNNLFLVDGVNNNDVGSNRTILVYPSTEAIAEFKMVRNSYGPEYGQASGAIISITTKSGTNQFHGGFFYAGRNDALDANDWYSNHAANPVKAELRRNDWGYHIGGPAIKNKLFFFWGQEWNREVRGTPESACVPTAAEQSGDFSQDFAGASSANDAIATDQCGANQPAAWVGGVNGVGGTYTSTIPAALQNPSNPFALAAVDPAGALLGQFYPLPNAPLSGGTNWFDSEKVSPSWSEINGRADYDLTQKHRATFRWTQDSWKVPGPAPGEFWGDSIFPTVSSDWSQPSKSVMAKLTSQLGSSMVNDVEFGYGHNAIITTLSPQSAALVSQTDAAIPSAWPASLKQKGAYIDGGGAWGGLNPYGGGPAGAQTMWTIAPYGNHEDLYAIQDNISKVHGNHLFKAGAYYSTNKKIEYNNGGNDAPAIGPGQATVPTNNPLANILLPGKNTALDPTGVGQLFNTNENSVNGLAQVGWHDFEWYLGDTWKISHNVTLSYGFRWSFYREPFGIDNKWANFSLADWSASEAAANPSDACNGIVIVPGTTPCASQAALLGTLGVTLPLSNGTPGANRALVNNNNHSIAPRIGIAWDVMGDGKTAIRVGLGQFYQRELVGIDESLARNAPFVINANDTRTLETPAPLANPAVSPSAAKDPRAVVPNSWQWNLSVERQLARNTSLEVGYVGNSGIHLTSMADLNEVPSSDWINSSFLGTTGPNASTTNINSYRPANNFGMIGEFARGGSATYHSLQTLFRSRVGSRSSFQASYTWSHSIGDVELDNSSGSVNQEAFINPANTHLDRGNTNINRPNIFVANEVFDLPKFAGSNSFVQQTLGGWELNSIINIQSGASFSVYSNIGGGKDVNAGVSPMAIPNLPVGALPCGNPAVTPGTTLADCYQLNSLTGTGFGNNQRPDATGIACNAGQNGNQILNTGAFTLTGYTIGTVGNAHKGSCYGADARTADVQLAKNWKIKERYGIKFQFDFFNLLNHPNFDSFNLEGAGYVPGSVACGSTACSPVNNVITSQTAVTGFGTAGSVHPGREIQYTLKFTF
ncbi:MAG: carboxypeptidase regulatory-like domain-containing protein, partial [Candidatus Sulfotelmatobacter sp.]